MRILILGSSTINKGAEAMLRTVQVELSRRIPSASYYIGDHRARQWHAESVVEAGVPLAPVANIGGWRYARVLANHALRAPEGPMYWIRNRDRLGYIEALTDFADGAVDISGFLFSDQRGERTSERLVPIVEMFARRGKPFAFLPQAWGPFKGDILRDLTKRACSSASLVYARDSTSRRYLEPILDGSTTVSQAPDVAFLFEPSSNGTELIAELKLDPGRPLVAIAPNMRVYERTKGEGDSNEYAATLARAGRQLLNKGTQLLLIPHEILPPDVERHDDRYLCSVLSEMIAERDVAAITTNRTAKDLKAMIGMCDLVVGSRYHALIAALSCGVPAVALGWSHKYVELLDEFGMKQLVFDYSTFDSDELMRAVLEVWDQRSLYQARILKHLTSVRARSSEVFDRVANSFVTSRS